MTWCRAVLPARSFAADVSMACAAADPVVLVVAEMSLALTAAVAVLLQVVTTPCFAAAAYAGLDGGVSGADNGGDVGGGCAKRDDVSDEVASCGASERDVTCVGASGVGVLAAMPPDAPSACSMLIGTGRTRASRAVRKAEPENRKWWLAQVLNTYTA